MDTSNLGTYGDDDDLPAAPATQPAAPAPHRNELGQFVSTTAPAPKPTAQDPQTPSHHPYMLAKARQYGIDASAMTPETLGAVLQAVEATRQAQPTPQPKPPEPEKPPEIDWGEDDAGNPITSEEQAKKVYPRPVFNAIKQSHQVTLLQKQNEQLQQTIERERAERNAARLESKLNRLLAARPELFGQNPGANEPGSIEAVRRQAVINHLNGLVATKQQTTLENDVATALAMFGPAAPTPTGKKQPKPDLAAAYRQAELARVTGRRGNEPLSRRELLIEQERAKMESNGSTVAIAGDDDYDDDLPGPLKG